MGQFHIAQIPVVPDPVLPAPLIHVIQASYHVDIRERTVLREIFIDADYRELEISQLLIAYHFSHCRRGTA